MINELGKFLRKLRIEKGERLADMSINLDISSAFLSAIERGKKSPPSNFEEKVSSKYELHQPILEEFLNVVSRARTKVELAPETDVGRETVGLMARRMNSLSDDQLEAIRKILKERGE